MFSSTMLNKYKHPCVLTRFEEASDGRGGQNTEWTEVAEFEGLFDYKSSTQVLIAEKQGFTSVYTIYVPKTLAVQHHDVIRRVSDGLTLRVTHDGTDDMTPDTSAINWKQIKAEKWVMPTC